MDQRDASLHRGLEALRDQHVAGDALDSFEPLEVGLGAGPHETANGEAVGREPTLRGVDAAVQAAVSAGEVPGAVVLVGQGARVLYRRAFGSRSLVPRQELMTEDPIFD